RHSFILASDLAVAPTAAVGAFKENVDGMARQGVGEDFPYLGGHIALGPQGMELLSDFLPPIIHVRAALAEAGVLRWLLDQLGRGEQGARPLCRHLPHQLV
ncbi:cupin domain-containing protein, partial [Rhizobium ruizarguesonis]